MWGTHFGPHLGRMVMGEGAPAVDKEVAAAFLAAARRDGGAGGAGVEGRRGLDGRRAFNGGRESRPVVCRSGAPRGRRGGAGSVDEEHRGDDRRGEVHRERGGVQRPARGAGRRRTGAGWRTAGGDQASGVGPGGPTSMRGRAWGGLGEQRQELGARRRGRRGVR